MSVEGGQNDQTMKTTAILKLHCNRKGKLYKVKNEGGNFENVSLKLSET